MKHLFVFFSVLGLLFSLGAFSSVEAQTCSGTFTCRRFAGYSNLQPPGCSPWIPGDCEDFDVNYETGTDSCAAHQIPNTCSNDWNQVCQTTGWDDAIAASCSSGGGGGCTSNNDCPGCQSCNFGTGACYDDNGWCPSGQFCSGAVCYPPAATPTPTTPPQCSPPNSYYDGTWCVSCNSCYDRYCDGGSNIVETYYSGSTCAFCCPTGAPTATPPPGPTSPPPPTPTPGGGGGCIPGDYLCGGACISGCATCNSGWPDYSTCGGGGGGPICGDGVCDEGCAACASDCGVCPFCGDGICNGGETNGTCPGDCPPPTYSISGTVFLDLDNDGGQDCVANAGDDCNNSTGDEPGIGNATLQRIGPGADPTTQSDNSGSNMGDYTFGNILAGTYSIQLTIPSGYELTAAQINPRTNIGVGPSRTEINFGLALATPDCTGGLSANPSTVQPGASSTLSVTSCTGNENPDNGNPPPVFDWDPDAPPGGGTSPNNPACGDTRDNDGDGVVDVLDPGCHTDGDVDTDNDGTPDATDNDDDNDGTSDGSDSDDDGDGIPDTSDPTWPDSYNPNDDSETNGGGPNPQCSDGVDNDSDGVIDSNDPGCHEDTGKDSDGDGTSDGLDSDDDGDGTPDISDSDDDGDGINDGSDPDWTGTYNPGDDSEQDGSSTRNDSSTSNPTNTPTSSTTTWTAPVCPSSQLTVNPQVVVNGAGGQTSYSTAITVPATYTLTTHVRTVTDPSVCNSSSGDAYNDGSGNGAQVNVTGSGGYNLSQETSSTTGSVAFACLPAGNYQAAVGVPAGYEVLGTSGGTSASGNTITVTGLNSNRTIVFCIAPTDPWFQTDFGDVRFINLTNPVPPGQYASSEATYPGIFYSSESNANFGPGAASVPTRNWIINNEYSFNTDTQNRNGGMSYDFYKSKARQDGVAITQITPGTLNSSEILQSEAILNENGGVFESNGPLTIGNYTHPAGKRVVILVNGDVVVSDPDLLVDTGDGLFIVAAKGDITIADTVGTATLTSIISNLDGYYTAQGDITIQGDGCSDGITPDRKLVVGGALVANSLKPFASNAVGGRVINNRSLCLDNLNYPALRINSRPDFLTQMTDFYKVSYTKWNEVKP